MIKEESQLLLEKTLEMLENFFLPELRNNAVVENCYFHQDGVPAHYARQVRDFLNQLFPAWWIGRRDLLKWAACSPDLTPCDFFSLEFPKELSLLDKTAKPRRIGTTG